VSVARSKAGKPTQVRLQLDHRTNDMTEEALECRGWNHLWQRQTLPPNQVLAMLAQGYAEAVRNCRCGAVWRQVYDANSFDVVLDRHDYPNTGFKVPPGTGRLNKREARKAAFAREHPGLVAFT
jgi:hypothetical protein